MIGCDIARLSKPEEMNLSYGTFPSGTFIIISRQIPGVELVTFPGAGHGLMYQYPDRYSDIIVDFLDGSGRRRKKRDSYPSTIG
jgi:hypothetical protein